MDLNKVTFETPEIKITIQQSGTNWFFQVLKGYGMTIHVESRDFGTYKAAVDYAFEKYDLVTE